MASTESKVISSICKNKDVHHILGEDPELFGSYGDIFEFVKGYYLRHKTTPSKSLIIDKFPDAEIVDTDSPTPYYLEELKSEFVGNRLDGLLLRAARARSQGETPAQISDKLNAALAKLAKYSAASRDVNLTDADAAAEHFQALREKSLDGGLPGIPTGFESIDCAYSTGLSGGHSIVLMGYTSRGKSMFAALMGVKAWAQGKKVLVISLEMTPEEYRERVYAMMSSGLFKISDMSRGDVNQDDFRTWSKKALDKSSDFIVVDNQGMSEITPNFIQGKIDTHRPDLVIFDYVQLGMDNAKTQAMTPRMMNLSRELKLLAVSNNIPIISITAVTDEDNDKRDAPPLLSQVSWSHAIEYDANMVIAVHRHDDSNVVEVVGRKNRHGDLFGFFFKVDFNAGVWEECWDLADAQ